jgi:hypothetical protein
MIRRTCGFRISDFGFRIRHTAPIRNPQSAIRNSGWVCLLVLFGSANVVLAYGNPPAGPVNRGTIPPSSYQTSLVNMPSPIDNTNNRVVTGNVSGGKSFRGNIPYGSTTSFSAPLGSTSLDPFLRYSAVPEEWSDGSPAHTPFYSPTGTVSRIQPGAGGVFAPGSPRVAGTPMQFYPEQPGDVISTPEVPPSQIRTGQTAGDGFLPPAGRSQAMLGATQLLSRTPDDMRRIIAGAPGDVAAERRPVLQGNQVLTPDEYRRQVEQLQRDFDKVKTNAFQFEQGLKAGKETPEQKPATTIEPMVSPETLRNILQPRTQPSLPSPPKGQDLPGQPAPATLDGSPSPGQTQGQATGSLSDLALLSPQSLPAGVQASASTESRLQLHGQPAGPRQPVPDLSAQQKSRINAIFAPQMEAAPVNKAGPDPMPPLEQATAAKTAAVPAEMRMVQRSSGGLPATQRVEAAPRALDAPAAVLERSLRDSVTDVPSPTTDDIVNPQTRPVTAGVPVRPNFSLLPNKVESSGTGTSLSPGYPQASASWDAAAQTGKAQPKPAGSPPPLLADLTSPKAGNPDPTPQEKFDRCMRSARQSMQQGQYARAAETFGLAGVYNPKDARPQIGRSHALLAAGEYVNSAACLAKAIELDPRVTLQKMSLIEAVGGPDQFVQRITDLDRLAKTGDAPALQLLLAYVYQQMDWTREAKAAIQAAKKAMPSSPSVVLLAAAIEGVTPG